MRNIVYFSTSSREARDCACLPAGRLEEYYLLMANPQDEEVTYIGKCNFRGGERVFGIKKKDRRQHMYVIGKTGVGKSVLLKNMALQDIRAGRGIGIVDPHGEFVEEVLEQIPASRINDVVYFNPVDADYPIGFNILEVPDVRYKHLVVSDLLGIFTKIWANVWSARMEYILQNCILALIDTPGTTLLGIPRILVEKEYRDKIVANVQDPVVRSFWTQEYETWRDQFRNEAIVPIQNKVGQFLNTGFVRNIVGQPVSTINIPEIMNSGKILLVNVSKGRIGEDNAALLGAMIITKIQLAAMERVRIPEDERKDFYLYVDEFQNFSTDSFAAILSEARKYRLNLFIAHQYVGQLVTDVSTKVRDAVFGNVGTMICFRVGATDAEFLEKEFEPEFLPQDLINLPNYTIYLKLMVDGVTSRPFSAGTLAPLKYEIEPDIRNRIIDASRRQYSNPREEVERQITEASGGGFSQTQGAPRAMGGGGGSQSRGGGGGNYGSSGGGSRGGGGGNFPPSGGGSSSMTAAAGAPVQRTAGGAELFEAQCWNCGKMTQVPFKPDSKRPVYCLSCLKQIEEGKLIPLPDRMPSAAKARYGSTLGDLGIEFESKKPTEARPAQAVGEQTERPQQRTDERSFRDRPQEPRRQDNRDQRSDSGPMRPRPRASVETHGVAQDTSPRGQEQRRPAMNPDRERTTQRMQHGSEQDNRRADEGRQELRNALPLSGVRSRPIVRVPQGSVKMSLQSLKSSEKEKTLPDGMSSKKDVVREPASLRAQKEVNTSDLRSILSGIMNERRNVKPDPRVEVPVGQSESVMPEKMESEKPSESGVLKPGDTIKF